MTALYPYTAPRAGSAVEHYQYSPFHGHAFFAAWRETRNAPLPAPATGTPPAPCATERTIAAWHEALQKGSLDASRRQGMDALLRNYEAKKRLFADYEAGFTSKGRTDAAPLSCWIAFASLLLAIAQKDSLLPPLNAALKLHDTLIGRAGELTAEEQRRLQENLAREQRLIETLAAAIGVEIG